MRPRAGMLACIVLTATACQGGDPGVAEPTVTSVAVRSMVAPDVPPDPEAVCGPGDGTATAEPVRVMTLADASGPGGAPEAVTAFAASCNDLGGIGGRPMVAATRLVGNVEEQVAAVDEACRDQLALVGSSVRLEPAVAQLAVDCGLPDIPADAVNPLHADGTNVVAPLPNPVGAYDVGPARHVQATHPEAVTRAAILFGPGADELNARRQVEAYERVGWSFAYQALLTGGPEDLDVHVLQLRERGVRALILRAPPSTVAAVLAGLAAAGVAPEVVEADAGAYDPSLPAVAGAAADGLLVAVPVVPLEDEPATPELERYRGWLGAVHPEAAPSATGARAWSAALLFARAASAAGDGLDRATLLVALRSVPAWDGRGLHAPSDPAHNVPAGCFVYLRVEGDRFVRDHPAEGFACGDHRLGLIGDYGEGAKPRPGG